MQRFRKILVGVDLARGDRLATSELSEPNQEAIDKAVWLAGQTASEVTFFSAIDISAHTQHLLENSREGTSTVRDSAQAVLDEIVKSAQEQGVEARSKLVFGRSWMELIRQVLREGHDLVIVGTRDLSVSRRLLVGSTAMKLLRKCPCPVWVTKPESKPDDEVLDVLVASDFSEVSDQALQIAVEGGQLRDARIHLVHALEDDLSRQVWLTGVPEEEIDTYHQKLLEETENRLKEQLAQTDYRTLTYDVQTHVLDSPADLAILQAIEDFKIDLLVMGTVGRSGVPGFLIGNTAERILPELTCSLLAVKPADFQTPVELD